MNYWGSQRAPRINSPAEYGGFGYESDIRNVGVKAATVPFLNIDELRKEERSSERNAKQIFKLILAKCHQKIRRTNKTTDYRMCYYEIPHFIPGYPVFDVEAARNFVYHQLLGNGLYVEPIGPSRLYISWKEDDINRDVYEYRSQKMVNKPNLYKIGVSPVDEREENRRSSGTPRIIGSNVGRNTSTSSSSSGKKKGVDDEEHVSMLQYDSTIADLVPVNAKKVSRFREDDGRTSLSLDDVVDGSSSYAGNSGGTADRSNIQRGYYDTGIAGNYSTGEVTYPPTEKKRRRRRRKSREDPRSDPRSSGRSSSGSGYNVDAHREMYKQNMMDLDQQYIPSSY
jgi:hypothetical protein